MKGISHIIHPVDEHVGRRLKLKRLERNLTQHQLAESVGITFQQIQKYEKGTNRVSSSKLFEISQTLKVAITYFFDGLGNANYEYKSKDNYVALFDSANSEFGNDNQTSKEELQDLVQAYLTIKDPEARKNLVELAKNLAKS